MELCAWILVLQNLCARWGNHVARRLTHLRYNVVSLDQRAQLGTGVFYTALVQLIAAVENNLRP